MGGRWTLVESNNYVDWLELQACCLSLQYFYNNSQNVYIHVDNANTVVLSYILNKECIVTSLNSATATLTRLGPASICPLLCLNNLVSEVWLWYKARNLWLISSHIPGVNNTLAELCLHIVTYMTNLPVWSGVLRI